MLSISLKGSKKIAESSVKIRKLRDGFDMELLKILNRFGLQSISTSRDKYFLKSGGRGKNLGDILISRTGRLRSSVRMKNPTMSGHIAEMSIFSNVRYAKKHEEGIGVRKRSFLKPAMMEHMPELRRRLGEMFKLYGK